MNYLVQSIPSGLLTIQALRHHIVGPTVNDGQKQENTHWNHL